MYSSLYSRGITADSAVNNDSLLSSFLRNVTHYKLQGKCRCVGVQYTEMMVYQSLTVHDMAVLSR